MVSTHFSPTQPSQLSSHQQSAKKTATAAPSSPIIASPFKRKTMSLTQTYYLAHKARAKLSAEAQRPDHDLRKLVGSANLLDALMVELADAEREQESWFNQSVRGATTKKTIHTQDRRVQWADGLVEEPEEDWEADDALSDSDDEDSEYDDEEDEDVEMADAVSLTRIPSHSSQPLGAPTVADDEDYFDEDEEEDYAQLTLTRSQSRSATSPPDLDHDSDSSEDESMPPSPPTASLPSFPDDKQQTQEQHDEVMASPQSAFYSEGFYLPPRSPGQLVSAVSVY